MSPSVSLDSSVESVFLLGLIAAAACAAGDWDTAGGRDVAEELEGSEGTNVPVPVIDLLENFIPGTNLCLLTLNCIIRGRTKVSNILFFGSAILTPQNFRPSIFVIT